MTRRLAGVLLVFALVGGACSLMPAIQQEPPRPCEQLYGQDRCLAMVDVAAAEVGKNRGDVAAIAIVPDPPPEGATLGGAWPINVRIALKDGSTYETRICGGVSVDPACSEPPRLQARSVIGAYTDVPCGVDPDDTSACATPHPEPNASTVDAAMPIAIDSVSIPIDRPGPYEVPLGQGSLPNGILNEAAFEFGQQWPDDVALRDGRARLDVKSLEPDGKPFDNYYSHGWREGVERVRAVLAFDVLWFAPGATLEIRNVVVR